MTGDFINLVPAGTQLPASNSILYTATGDVYCREVIVHNTNASTLTWQISIVPSGDTAGTQHILINPPGGIDQDITEYYSLKYHLASGDRIYGFASSAASINIVVFGVEG